MIEPEKNEGQSTSSNTAPNQNESSKEEIVGGANNQDQLDKLNPNNEEDADLREERKNQGPVIGSEPKTQVNKGE